MLSDAQIIELFGSFPPKPVVGEYYRGNRVLNSKQLFFLRKVRYKIPYSYFPEMIQIVIQSKKMNSNQRSRILQLNEYFQMTSSFQGKRGTRQVK